MKNNAPCMNCDKRTMGCHSTCEAYKNFKLNNEVFKEKRLLEKNTEHSLSDIKISSYKKKRR